MKVTGGVGFMVLELTVTIRTRAFAGNDSANFLNLFVENGGRRDFETLFLFLLFGIVQIYHGLGPASIAKLSQRLWRR